MAPSLLLALLGACHEPVEPEPAEQVSHWCEAVRGGPSSDALVEVGLSEAHTGVRLFSPEGDWLAADEALVGALEDPDPFHPDVVHAYAAALEDVCAVAADDTPLGEAELVQEDDLAVVTPGTGVLTLPAGTAGVVVDLRGLPATVEAHDALLRAVGLALAGEVEAGQEQHRTFFGHPDQASSQPNIYEAGSARTLSRIEGTGEEELPIFLLTDRVMGSRTAALAGGLRLAGRAWLVGYDVFGAQAECEWSPVGDQGLAWRGRVRLVDAGGGPQPWPDRIPADLSTSTPERVLVELLEWGEPPPVGGTAERSELEEWETWVEDHDLDAEVADRRAALLVLHGALQRFFPYFDVVGDTTEQALLDGLAEVEGHDPADRTAMLHTLGRYVHVLHDGHAWSGDHGVEPPWDGWLDIQLQHVASEDGGEPTFGELWVRRSEHPEVVPGDLVVAVDGVPVAEWSEEIMARYSASTLGLLVHRVVIETVQVEGTRSLTLRDLDGLERTVTPNPLPHEETVYLPSGTYRESGWLEDLDAPELYFLNLSQVVTPTLDLATASIAEARAGEAAGLVVDMRHYPGFISWDFVPWLRTEAYSSALFYTPVWDGPERLSEQEWQMSFTPEEHAYDGPIALLVSNFSVSAAENLSVMLAGSDRVTVVGQRSAGTNGSLTSVALPGRFHATFTGQEALFPDGSTFFGVGVVPDVEVIPTREELAAGVDPELVAAIEVLGGR